MLTYGITEPARTLPARNQAQLKREFVALPIEGTTLRLAVLRRHGDRPAVVFLHGFGSTKEDFADIAHYPQFDGRGVIAFDAPGCGESAHSQIAVTIPAMRNVLERVLTHYDVSRFHLVGHSMGGLTALQFARSRPAGLLSFTNMEGNLAPEDCFLSRQVVHYDSAGADAFLDAFVERLLDADGYCCPLYAAGLRSKVRTDVVAPIFRSIVALSGAGGLLKAFVELPCPRLFMYGDANRSLSYLGLLRTSAVELAEIPHCGHFPMYANPPVMWARIAEFVDRSEMSRTRG